MNLTEVVTLGLSVISSVADAIREAQAGKINPEEALRRISEVSKQDQAVDGRVDAAISAKFPEK